MPDYSDLLPDMPPEQANQLILDKLKNPNYETTQPSGSNNSAAKDLWPYVLGAAGPAIAKGAGALASKIPGSAITKSIIPALLAAKLPRKVDWTKVPSVESNPEFINQAIENSGVISSPEGLSLNLIMYQKPEQMGKPARSGGVFYTPQSNKWVQGFFNGSNFPWGGSQPIQGTTLLRNPYFSHASPGGESVDRVGRELSDIPELFDEIGDDAYSISKKGNLKDISDFLKEHAPEVKPPDIKYPFSELNRRRIWPWLKEAAAGHKARAHGYDSIVGVDDDRNFAPTIHEIFDLRESHYPVQDPYQSKLWPHYESYLKGP